MKEIMGINHIGIRVSGLQAARAFYERLGFEFIVGPIGPEPVAVMAHPAGVVINLILNGSDSTLGNVLMDVSEKYPGYTHFAFDISNIKMAQASIEEAQITITEGPVALPNGDVMFFIRDPDGNVIEFHQNAGC